MSLAQGNNTPTWPRIEPGSPDPESDALTTKMGQGQPRVIIYVNVVELESPMLDAKFQDHRTSGF